MSRGKKYSSPLKFFLFRANDLSGYCTCCCCFRWCQINFHLGSSHTAKEITVICCHNTLSVRKNTSCSSTAQSTSRMCDHCTCFCQSIQDSKFNSLSVYFTACRCNDQFYIVSNFLSFEDFSCRCKVFQTAICTGTDKYLIDLSSLLCSCSRKIWQISLLQKEIWITC